jgi:hypothetical protein
MNLDTTNLKSYHVILHAPIRALARFRDCHRLSKSPFRFEIRDLQIIFTTTHSKCPLKRRSNECKRILTLDRKPETVSATIFYRLEQNRS